MSGKRANVFAQGRPESPYEDRDGPPDPPQRATAAQLAARKIKSVKPRRPAGASSGMSQSAGFGSAPPIGGFGMPNTNPSENGANSFSGFGGSATSSFPPAQPAEPSNTFASSSFPAFGASTQSTGFNPQPPSSMGFNFASGGINPFAASAPAPVPVAPTAVNGSSSAPAFGGSSSLFNAQPTSNPFGGLGQGSISSAPSGTIFGSASDAPQTNMFGATSAAPAVTSTPTPTSMPFTFGSTVSAAPTTTTSATSNTFGGFGAATQTAPPAQTGLFSFGSPAPKSNAPPQLASNDMFGSSTGTSAQPSNSTAAAAPAAASNLFGFGSTAPKSDAPGTTLFGTSTSSTPSTSTSAPLFAFGSTAPKTDAPAHTLFAASGPASSAIDNPVPAPVPAPAAVSNPFATLSAASGSTTTKPSLFSSSHTLKMPEVDSNMSKNSFGGLNPVGQNNDASAKKPKGNPFGSLSQPVSTASPAASPGFSLFGASRQNSTPSINSEQPPKNANVPSAPQSKIFNGFSTPQPAKNADFEKATGGLFNTVQPKTNTGISSQSSTSEPQASSLFKPSGFIFTPPVTSSAEPSKEAQATSSTLELQAAPMGERQNHSGTPKESVAASPDSALPASEAAMEMSAGTPKGPELPRVPKVHVPKGWVPPGSVAAHGAQGLYLHISDLVAQLHALNDRYRQQLLILPLSADWSAVSLWHHHHSHNIKKQIDNARKQGAAAKGITGNETALSTKRKANEEGHDNQNSSPSKRTRGPDVLATPTPRSVAQTSSLQPPATCTSSMFARAINGTRTSPTPPKDSSLYTTEAAKKSLLESSNTSATASGFTTSSSASKTTGIANSMSSSSGFKPNFGGLPSSGFKPAVSPSSGGASFMDQFKKTAKTYDELAAERKAKVMAEDYDSDDETEEEWSARYDKEEAERLAEEKKQVAANIPKFSLPASTKLSGGSTPAAGNPFAVMKTTASPAPTPNVSIPRASSPAPSTGSQSVFDIPSNTSMPANIFGHLSSGSSSSHQDGSDDEDSARFPEKSSADQPFGSVEPTTPSKRKFGTSETKDDETQEETMGNKRQDTDASSKGSLLSRMTKANPGDGDFQKDSGHASALGQGSGSQTPTSKPFQFFDFSAASSKSASPKPESFAGDQTFKPGTPIKFGDAPTTQKKTSGPTFQFQPATPAPGEFSTTPAKPPPPTSLFNFATTSSGPSILAASTGLSSASSMPSSVFSSRAGTPLSEADTNASAVDNEEEDSEKQAQVDLSQLTKEETDANDVIFHMELVLAKHIVNNGVEKTWGIFAKGPIWILKDKKTAKCLVRIRLANGSTPLNYSILPSLRATVYGNSKKMVMASRHVKEGGLQSVLYCFRSSEIAAEFAAKYNDSLPSN